MVEGEKKAEGRGGGGGGGGREAIHKTPSTNITKTMIAHMEIL